MKKHSPFRGKTIAILAPGSSIATLNLQNNQFDVVCAVGNWFRFRDILIPKIVSKIDVVYPSPNLLRQLNFIRFNPIWFPEIRIAKEHNIKIHPDLIEKTSFYNFNFNLLSEEVGCNLTTGMAAILDVFYGNPKSISLFGFDFYQLETPYCPGYASKFNTRLIQDTQGNISRHNQHLLKSYFAKYIYNHVQVDPTLKIIIEQFPGSHT